VGSAAALEPAARLLVDLQDLAFGPRAEQGPAYAPRENREAAHAAPICSAQPRPDLHVLAGLHGLVDLRRLFV
jgi:hypothetical protein